MRLNSLAASRRRAVIAVALAATSALLSVPGPSVSNAQAADPAPISLGDLDITPAGSNPSGYIAAGGLIYFSADDGHHGQELWSYDQITGETALVLDINSGESSSPIPRRAVGSSLLFTADDGVHGNEVWITDGTAAGTRMVADINPGIGSSSVNKIVAMGGIAYFAADNGDLGQELWSSDGTESNTTMVADLRLGATGSRPEYLEVVKFGGGNRALYFEAYVDGFGTELVRYDTVDGITTFDINPGSSSSTLHSLTVVGNALYFSGAAGGFGTTPFLYRVTGSTAATTTYTSLVISTPSYLTATHKNASTNKLFFVAGNLSSWGFAPAHVSITGTAQDGHVQ